MQKLLKRHNCCSLIILISSKTLREEEYAGKARKQQKDRVKSVEWEISKTADPLFAGPFTGDSLPQYTIISNIKRQSKIYIDLK